MITGKLAIKIVALNHFKNVLWTLVLKIKLELILFDFLHNMITLCYATFYCNPNRPSKWAKKYAVGSSTGYSMSIISVFGYH